MGCGLIFLIPVYICKGIYSFLRWSFTSGWKGYAALIIAVIIGLTGILVIRSTFITNDKPAAIQEIVIPARKTAPYLVETSSRQYYAAKAVKDKAGDVTMTDYWELLSNQWVKTPGEYVLEVETYGTITVTKRRK